VPFIQRFESWEEKSASDMFKLFSFGPIAIAAHVLMHIYMKPFLPLRFGKLHLLDIIPRHVIYRPSTGLSFLFDVDKDSVPYCGGN
jgi:hypothetical protein